MKVTSLKKILILLLGYFTAFSITPTYGDFHSTRHKIHFRLITDNTNYFLEIIQDEDHQEIPIPRSWLVPTRDDENGYVSSTNYDRIVNTFKIGNGLTGIHISSYDIQPEGSAQAAAGRDVFLVYHHQNNIVHPGLINLGITKERIRSTGEFLATHTKFLLSDINRDGLIDLGIIKEEFKCTPLTPVKIGMNLKDQPFYTLNPIKWYIFNKNSWIYERQFEGRLSSISYKELPLVGIVKSPVEFVKEICLHKNILILEYPDFGIQAMAYELIGYQWYQWNSHGDPNPDTQYNIKVVVYKDFKLKEVKHLYPIHKDLRWDYRYIEYTKVIEYCNKQLEQIEEFKETDHGKENHDLYNELMSRLQNTKKQIETQLGP
jgi:hypothetical protein